MATRLPIGASAPNFELTDTHGRIVRLSDFYGKKFIVLVLLRGFI
jgi:peroxiredoxin